MDVEIRSLPFSVTAQNDGDRLTVSGIVNRVGSVSEIITNRKTGKQFRETIEPGVFARAIERAKRVDFLSMHDKNQVLSTTDNSSLELRETDEGLSMNAQISGTSWGQDTYKLINDGIIKGMSFGMRVLNQAWSRGSDGLPLRTIKDIDLFEVSAVRNPAYKSSVIEARDADHIIDVDIPEDIEEREDMSEEDKKKAAEAEAAKKAEEAKKTSEGKDPEDDTSKEDDKKSDGKKSDEKKSDKKDDAKKDDEKRDNEEEDKDEEIRSLNQKIDSLQGDFSNKLEALSSQLTALAAEVRSNQEEQKDEEHEDQDDDKKDEEHRDLDKDKKIADLKDAFFNQL